MKTNLLLLTLILSLSGFSQGHDTFLKAISKQTSLSDPTKKSATIVNLMDSSYTWGWVPANNNWNAPYRNVYSYNAFYKENGSVTSSWSGSMWNNYSRNTAYTFDVNNNNLSQTSQYWIGTSWENNSKITNTYDASNNLLTNLNQTWNFGTNTWENGYNTTNTYDASNNLLTSIGQSWNTGTSAWENSYKSVATYTTGHQYLTYVQQVWNAVSNSWVNSSKIINLIYSNGDLTGYEMQSWNNMNLTYEPNYKDVCTYDANHHMLNYLSQYWNDTPGFWENSTKGDYTYDSNGNQATVLYQQWSTTNNVWVNSNREYDYYTSLLTAMDKLTKQNLNINVYPNPATNFIIVSSANKELFNEIIIMDVAGKVVLSEQINASTSTALNIESLTPGIYFMNLKGESFSDYKKIVKE